MTILKIKVLKLNWTQLSNNSTGRRNDEGIIAGSAANVNADKEVKIRLQNQLKIIDWQRDLLRKDLLKRKEEKARLQKEYYQRRYQY